MDYVNAGLMRPGVTNSIVKNLIIGSEPTTLLQSKFKRVVRKTLAAAWNVKRFGETVETDVVRGADGNLVKFPKMTYKDVVPPYYYNKLNVTQVDGYDRVFSAKDSGNIEIGYFNDFRANLMEQIKQLQARHVRAVELQAQEVFSKGTVTPVNAPQIDFKRHADSIIPYSDAVNWSDPNVDPRILLEKMCIYERAYGQSEDSEFDAYVGAGVYSAFINNPFIVRAEQFHVNELTAANLKRLPTGAVAVKRVNCGSFAVNIITYPQVYTPAGVTDLTGAAKVPYIGNGQIFLTPVNAEFGTICCAVPMLPPEILAEMPGWKPVGTVDGMFYIGEYLDVPRRGWYLTIESAPLTVPFAVDQMVTATVLPG